MSFDDFHSDDFEHHHRFTQGLFKPQEADFDFGTQQSSLFPADRNIFGRFGRLYIYPVSYNPKSLNQDQSVGAGEWGVGGWLANITSVKATFNIDKTEVRMCGDVGVKYKPGEFTGAGTLTFDKVNSDFERLFIDHVSGVFSGTSSYDVPRFYLAVSLEDGNFGFEGRGKDSAALNRTFNSSSVNYGPKGHEQIKLECVQFWGLPLGYDTTSMISQDLEFTFQGISFGSDIGGEISIKDSNYEFPTRIC